MPASTSVVADRDRLLSRQDVCALLNVSLRTLDGIVQTGRLQPIKVSPGLLRFRLADVRRYIRAQQVR